MKREELIQQLDKNDLDKIYVLYGKEIYLIKELEDKFKALANPATLDFNQVIIDGKETNIDMIQSAVETLPFMDERRYIIIKDFELFKGRKKNFNDNDEKKLLEILESAPETSLIVFAQYEEVDTRRSFFKKLGKFANMVELKKLEDVQLLNWSRQIFNKYRVNIENSVIAYMVEMSGYSDKKSDMNLMDLENEIKKLCVFVGDAGRVDKPIIDQMMKDKVENDVFKFLDYMSSKNSKMSVKLLEDMIDSGESGLGIIFLITRQVYNIIQIKRMQKERMPYNIIRDNMGMSSFVVNKLSRQANNFSEEILVDMINYLSDSDYMIKQGLIGDRLSLEIFIAKYCK